MPMTRDELIEAVQDGALAAERTYFKWSGGSRLSEYGVEGFLVSEICRSIRKVQDNGYLTMEEPVDEMVENTGRRRPMGRHGELLNGSKRVDIALWNAQWQVTSVIEVKRHWNPECLHDLDRIEELQRRFKTIQCGLFVMLVETEGGRKSVEEDIKVRQGEIREHLRGKCTFHLHPGSKTCSLEGWTATSLCAEVLGRH